MTSQIAISGASRILKLSESDLHEKIKKTLETVPKAGGISYIDYDISRRTVNHKFKRKIFSFHIVKGGVGKTTSLVNVASCLHALGAKVLLIDIDPQGNLTDNLCVDAEKVPVLIDFINRDIPAKNGIVSISEGFDLIPSRIENVTVDSFLMYQQRPLNLLFKRIFEEITSNYDYIFIDCPPMLGHVVTASYLFSDCIISPLNPEKFSIKALQILNREIDNIKKIFFQDINYRVFLNKYSVNTKLSGSAVAEIFSDNEYKDRRFNTLIRYSQEVPNLTAQGKSLFSNLRASNVKDDFESLVSELICL